MNILTKATVLVLNRNWRAINVRTPQEAFCMMAPAMAFIRNPHDIADWKLFVDERSKS
jgi:hypothetical protein